MWLTMAANVVVLPDPVGPVTRTRPRISSASRVDHLGKSQLADGRGRRERTRRMARATDDRW